MKSICQPVYIVYLLFVVLVSKAFILFKCFAFVSDLVGTSLIVTSGIFDCQIKGLTVRLCLLMDWDITQRLLYY